MTISYLISSMQITNQQLLGLKKSGSELLKWVLAPYYTTIPWTNTGQFIYQY